MRQGSWKRYRKALKKNGPNSAVPWRGWASESRKSAIEAQHGSKAASSTIIAGSGTEGRALVNGDRVPKALSASVRCFVSGA